MLNSLDSELSCILTKQQKYNRSVERLFFSLQANLNDSHNQMVVHWAGEKSNVIVALARDSVGATGPKTSSVSTQ